MKVYLILIYSCLFAGLVTSIMRAQPEWSSENLGPADNDFVILKEWNGEPAILYQKRAADGQSFEVHWTYREEDIWQSALVYEPPGSISFMDFCVVNSIPYAAIIARESSGSYGIVVKKISTTTSETVYSRGDFESSTRLAIADLDGIPGMLHDDGDDRRGLTYFVEPDKNGDWKENVLFLGREDSWVPSDLQMISGKATAIFSRDCGSDSCDLHLGQLIAGVWSILNEEDAFGGGVFATLVEWNNEPVSASGDLRRDSLIINYRVEDNWIKEVVNPGSTEVGLGGISMTVFEDVPRVLFRQASTKTTYYARRTDLGWQIWPIDDETRGDFYGQSLGIINGKLAMAYMRSDLRLIYAKLQSEPPMPSSVDMVKNEEQLDSPCLFDISVIEGHQPEDFLGERVSIIDDMDGDNIQDIILNSRNGEVYVLYGGSHLKSLGKYNLSNLTADIGFSIPINGFSVSRFPASASQPNALAVSAPFEMNSIGKIYVLFESTDLRNTSNTFDPETLDGTNGFTILGPKNGMLIGVSMATIGDINGDTVEDFAIGSLGNGGQVFVLFGPVNVDPPGILDLSQFSISQGFKFTNTVESRIRIIGDINNDGFDDIGIHTGGRFYAVFGKSTIGQIPSYNLSNPIPGDALWTSDTNVLGSYKKLGDINGDGIDDFAVRPIQGELYFIFGHTRIDKTGHLDVGLIDGSNGFLFDVKELLGDTSTEINSVSGIGDINKDGFNDFLVGVPDADPPGTDSIGDGRVYLLYGGPEIGSKGRLRPEELNCDTGISFESPISMETGSSVEGVGDMNGDGNPDFLLSDPFRDSGFVYILFTPDHPFPDDDEDGIQNCCDNCLNIPNPDQLDDDSDNVGNPCDNCRDTPNPNQLDSDADGSGNSCDTDENNNGIPDECDLLVITGDDCNINGILDICDISSGKARDCNLNLIPDACEVATGSAPDLDSNGIPDECETDCNKNSIPDDFDIELGNNQDCNENGILDVCDVRALDAIFLAPLNIPAGNEPMALVAIDLNNDGNIDFATTMDNNNGAVEHDIAVILGKDDGTYEETQRLSMREFTNDIIANDFDNNGTVDLATANNGVSIRQGNGDGTFQNPEHIMTAHGTLALVAVDFDDDEILDIATANVISHTVSFLKGNGDGSFKNPQIYAVGARPLNLVSGEFDNDRVLDIVTANEQNNSTAISVLIGNGDGTFQTALNYRADHSPYSLFAAHLNSDRFLDLVTIRSNILIHYGNGDGSFKPAELIDTGMVSHSIIAEDLNNDEHLDLISANSGTNNISLFLGDGRGNFLPSQQFPSGEGPYDIVTLDVNKDDLIDLATVNLRTNDVSLLINQTPPPRSPDVNTNGLPDSCDENNQVLGDCNQDGEINIADTICFFGVLFLGTPSRFPCGDGSIDDPNSITLMDISQPKGALNIADGIGLLQFLFIDLTTPPSGLGDGTCITILGCSRVEACP